MQTKDSQGLYLQSPKLNQLNILREVGANAHVTQAELASRCSLSVAMVNNYMKDLCNSDLIEYNRKSVKSVTYHLTPSGIQCLETLQSEQIGEMVRMFAYAKERIIKRIMEMAGSALQRVVLYGSGNLAQLAFHALELSGIRVLGVCDDDPSVLGRDFCGREVVNPSQIRFMAPDAVIITDSLKTDEILRNLHSFSDRGIELIYLDTSLVKETDYQQYAGSDPSSLLNTREAKIGSFSNSATNNPVF